MEKLTLKKLIAATGRVYGRPMTIPKLRVIARKNTDDEKGYWA